MDWKNALSTARDDAKAVVSDALQKLGVTPDKAVSAVDDLTASIEPLLDAWLTAHGLPAPLAAGAVHQLLGYLDAAAAGLIEGKKA
jgi:hypothetical protein